MQAGLRCSNIPSWPSQKITRKSLAIRPSLSWLQSLDQELTLMYGELPVCRMRSVEQRWCSSVRSKCGKNSTR